MASGIEQLEINIEHDIDEQYQYSPGEIIRGQIVVITSRKMTISSVNIHIKGEGVVAWDDPATHESYSTNEVYINATKLLPESENVTVPKGRRSFDFEYELPEHLPSSYIGKYGSVTYVLKATATGERRTDTTITSEPFLVLRYTLLDHTHDKKVYLTTQKRVHGTCWFGNVKVIVAVHRIGILPGEDLFIDAEIKNKSPRTITAVQAALLMDTQYLAQNRRNNFRQVINRRRDEVELLKNEGRRWQNVRLAVPPYIPESQLECCDIIDIDYVFQLRVEVEGADDITLDVPITVASQQNPQPKTETMTIYDLNTSNSTWVDANMKTSPTDIDDLDVNVVNCDPYNPHSTKKDWHGFTMPELRQDTNIVNPLFDKLERENSIDNNNEMTEVIESTKL